MKSSRLYRLLLHGYPPDFRRRFGPEMEDWVQTRRRESLDRGWWGLGTFWWETGLDYLTSVPSQRWAQFRSRAWSRPGAVKGELSVRSIFQDFKFGARGLVRNPGFAVIVIVMLALGVGGSAAAFSVVNGLLLRPLPFKSPEQMVYLDETAPSWGLQRTAVNSFDFGVWRESNQTFVDMLLVQDTFLNFSIQGRSERIRAARVTAGWTGVLGIEPQLGRSFRPEEDRPGAEDLALISHSLWQRVFAGEESVLGRQIRLNGKSYRVVGVMPAGIRFPTQSDIWVALRLDFSQDSNYSYRGVGRLKPGRTIEQAQEDLARVNIGLVESFDYKKEVSPVVSPLRDVYIDEQMKGSAWALLALVLGVLVIACANVSGLLLARGTTRIREIGIRRVLGAGRRRVIRLLLTESLLLALLGGVAGILLGRLGILALDWIKPASLPYFIHFGLDWQVLAFALAMGFASALLFGVLPALQAGRQGVRGALQDAGARGTEGLGKKRLMSVLVVGEVTLAFLLLVAAGLMIQTFWKLNQVDPGFEIQDRVSFRISLAGDRYQSGPQRIEFYRELQERLAALPGVSAVGAASLIPLTGGHSGYFLQVEGRPHTSEESRPVVLQRIATPSYFRAAGIRLISGRFFNGQDGAEGQPRGVIVNQTFAKRFFGEDEPVGHRIFYSGNPEMAMAVLAVVGDVKHYGLGREMRPGIYVPYQQMPASSMGLMMHGGPKAERLLASARQVIREIDPELPVHRADSMQDVLDRSLWPRQSLAWVFGGFASVALFMALGGIFGLLSYNVGRRRREIGIRMALGAARGQIAAIVLRQGLVLTVAGVVLGAAAAWGLSLALAGPLSDLGPIGLDLIGACTLVLIAIAFLAVAAPAFRATRLDPNRTLRIE